MAKNTTTSAPRHAREKKAKPTAAERAAAIEARRAAAADKALQAHRKRMADAQIPGDERTAHGARAYHYADLGKEKRASLNPFLTCFPRDNDRTSARLLAWSEFDQLQDKAGVGAIPPQKAEFGVDCPGGGAAGISDSRIDAARKDRMLRAHVGTERHDLLLAIVHQGKSLAQVGFTSEALGDALDRAAAFFGVADHTISPASRERIMTNLAAQAAQTFDHAEARRMVAQDRASARDVARHFGVSYRRAYTVVGDLLGGDTGARSATLRRWAHQGRRVITLPKIGGAL